MTSVSQILTNVVEFVIGQSVPARQPLRLMVDLGENNVLMINEVQSSHVP